MNDASRLVYIKEGTLKDTLQLTYTMTVSISLLALHCRDSGADATFGEHENDCFAAKQQFFGMLVLKVDVLVFVCSFLLSTSPKKISVLKKQKLRQTVGYTQTTLRT